MMNLTKPARKAVPAALRSILPHRAELAPPPAATPNSALLGGLGSFAELRKTGPVPDAGTNNAKVARRGLLTSAASFLSIRKGGPKPKSAPASRSVPAPAPARAAAAPVRAASPPARVVARPPAPTPAACADDTDEREGKGLAGRARLRERARCQAIMAHPAARHTVAISRRLAFETCLTRAEAIAVLNMTPMGNGTCLAARAAEAQASLAMMEAVFAGHAPAGTRGRPPGGPPAPANPLEAAFAHQAQSRRAPLPIGGYR